MVPQQSRFVLPLITGGAAAVLAMSGMWLALTAEPPAGLGFAVAPVAVVILTLIQWKLSPEPRPVPGA